ncbi:FecR domain-containing protein [Haloferula sp. BvORR071]|uniref:FecR domain-containing protein n=1 Tax=Haloferula sp. BvORR071 TaxID=1396141 RepID=UPI0005515E75|nr:FecR domain-containing protein [Haloferula sp. BvORR071]
MNSDDDTDFDSLCAQFLDGNLSEPDRDSLASMLEADPAKREDLRSQLLVSGALARMRPELSDEAFLHAVLPHLENVGSEDEGVFPGRVMNTIRFTRMRRGALAIAAVVAILAGLALFWPGKAPQGAPPGGEVVASLFQSTEESEEPRLVRVGEKLDFAEGVSRMEFVNGAVVAIEAPASLAVRSVDELALEHGKLNAWCPETAHGFRVVTGSATLVDLGTAFGVSADKDGTADFVVLEGKVEVKKDDETRTLLKGGAVRASRGKGRLRDLAYEPKGFQGTWRVASGIRKTRGEVVSAPPGTPEELAALEDDERIFVIPERRDLELSVPIQVDITEAGNYEGPNLIAAPEFQLQPKGRVRSYLMRYNPVGKIHRPDYRRFKGSVTFDRPVLAVIVGSRKLDRTDKVLSKAPLPPLSPEDAELRGLERTKGGDRVVLSKDRRTVHVTFYAGEAIDEIRAITADGKQ